MTPPPIFNDPKDRPPYGGKTGGGVKHAKAFIDGASRGNPGQAAIGVVFQDSKGVVVKNLSIKIGAATNNVAEYCALVFAMQEALMMRVEELDVFSDSELVVRQFSGEYKIKEASLQPFLLIAKHLSRGFKKFKLTHVPREQNKLADRQANLALDQFFSPPSVF